MDHNEIIWNDSDQRRTNTNFITIQSIGKQQHYCMITWSISHVIISCHTWIDLISRLPPNDSTLPSCPTHSEKYLTDQVAVACKHHVGMYHLYVNRRRRTVKGITMLPSRIDEGWNNKMHLVPAACVICKLWFHSAVSRFAWYNMLLDNLVNIYDELVLKAHTRPMLKNQCSIRILSCTAVRELNTMSKTKRYQTRNCMRSTINCYVYRNLLF